MIFIVNKVLLTGTLVVKYAQTPSCIATAMQQFISFHQRAWDSMFFTNPPLHSIIERQTAETYCFLGRTESWTGSSTTKEDQWQEEVSVSLPGRLIKQHLVTIPSLCLPHTPAAPFVGHLTDPEPSTLETRRLGNGSPLHSEAWNRSSPLLVRAPTLQWPGLIQSYLSRVRLL